MVTNLLGDVIEVRQRPTIISGNEIVAREGVNLQKGMNFREKGPLLSVFLVLPREDGFKDVWDTKKNVYQFLGHDSTTVESGRSVDQLLMYESGKISDNGKFYKAAHAFVDKLRKEPMQVQVYEKLDAGVWFDKGIFDLIDAQPQKLGGRKVYMFHLRPVGTVHTKEGAIDFEERMLPAGDKAETWEKSGGHCAKCKQQTDLHFVRTGKKINLLCDRHSGRPKRGLL